MVASIDILHVKNTGTSHLREGTARLANKGHIIITIYSGGTGKNWIDMHKVCYKRPDAVQKQDCKLCGHNDAINISSDVKLKYMY